MMARSPWVRILTVLLVISLALMGVVLTIPNVKAATWTQDTDTDFDAGTFTGTETAGTGAAAVVQLVKDATDWRNEAPGSNPGALEGPAMAYDSTNNVVVLFGGYDGANQGDTWEYDPLFNTWAQTSVTGPSARAYAGMAFDSVNGLIILFGGASDLGFEADTWEYNAATNTWIETTPATSPPTMGSYAMAFHVVQSRSILVGQSLVSGIMETWAYDASANMWTNRIASFAPPRSSHGLAYHAGLDRIVLFGGSFLVTIYGDTWEYNWATNSWTNTVADGNGPPARASMGVGYRPSASSVWMFGGTSGAPLSDTWRYFDVSGTRLWALVPTQRSPPARHTFGMTDEAVNTETYVYGGILAGGGRASDTWSFGPAYRGLGTWDSQTFDSLGANVNWNTIAWVGTQPPLTILRFQTASSDDPNPASWNFIGGAGCSAIQYYTTSPSTTCVAHDNHRYLRVRAYLLTNDNLNTPTMDSVTIDYTVPLSDPFIVFTDPPNPPDPDAFGVPLTDPILIRFSEPMNPSSVTYTINPPTATTDSWSETNSTLTIDHALPLQECKVYSVQVTAGTDAGGAPLNNGLNRVPNPFTFVTLCDPPEILATDPAQGMMDIPLDAPIIVNFSESMDIATVNWSTDPVVSLTGSWSMSNTRLTLTHAVDFMQCEMHEVTVTGEDLAGLALTSGPVPNPWDFHSVCTIPYIVSTTPSHLTTGVATTASIVVEFSEPMQPLSVTWDVQPFIALTPGWSNGDRTLTLSHAAPWSQCTMVRMEITGGKDVDGNDLFPGQHETHAPNPWKFAVTCPSPFLVATIPEDGTTGVGLLANVTIQFSESMNTASVTVTVNPPLTVMYTWFASDTLLVVSHALPFSCGSNVLLVDGQDQSGGNPMVPGLAPNPFTLIPACPNPFITLTDPVNDETGVGITRPILVTFSEPMNTTSVVWDIAAFISLSDSWDPTNTTLTLSHGAPFDQNTLYSVAIVAGQDVAGDPLAPGSVPNPWRFTTGGINPYIVSTNPTHGATGVTVTQNVVVTFSEPMDTSSVTVSPVPVITFTFAWDPTNTSLTLSHTNPFLECLRYNLTVGGDDVSGDPLGAGPVPNPWHFDIVCLNPVITDTNPIQGTVDVPLGALIWVNFSKAMDTASVVAMASPSVTFAYQWSNGDMTLRLSHGTFFLECTVYTITVTGNDTTANPLVAGPVQNPWSFRTFCPAPYIVSTSPADGATDVSTTGPIVVTFSRAMDVPQVSWQFTPGATATGVWSGGNTVVTLTPNPALMACTNYSLLIQGKSVEGKDLVPGPVSNPWAFLTVCSVLPPSGLTLTRQAPPNVHLAWTAPPVADSYNIYESQDRFAAWPWALLGTTSATSFDAPHLDDGLSHFYIVRAVRGPSESANSTMGAKIEMSVGFNPGGSNVYWFSLPYTSEYTQASDLATELGPGKVNVIGKWNPATQRTLLYYYLRGQWRGTDFPISAGDGLVLSSVSAFSWSIVGTDRPVTLSFTHNSPPLTNYNWIGLPYTNDYQTASDLVRDIEGGTGGGANTKIVEVVKWDAATQTVIRYFWTSIGWTGTDFAINPGDGIYFNIVSDFNWQPLLRTPEVP